MDFDVEELDVIIIGAGLSGICALIRTLKRLPHATVSVYEKSGSVAGTWAKNTYPGLSCDIPSQLYSYSFSLNPEWSNTYASQPEILSYIKNVVSGFDASRNIHLKQECVGAEWLDDELRWRVEMKDVESQRTYYKHTRFLITAVGFCDEPNGTEDILNIEDFHGQVFHSARWDHSVEFHGARVVVVGNGCSANQFIPHLVNQESVRTLTQVVRSRHWIAPKNDSPVPRWRKWLFRRFPISNRLLRYGLAAKLDLAFAAFRANAIGKLLRRLIQGSLEQYMRRTAPSKYHDILIPDFAFGAKRPILDHGYLEVLHKPNVSIVESKALTIIGPHDVRTDSGETVRADIIVLANGFKTQELLTPMIIKGRHGAILPEIWQKPGRFASAYMGVCVSDFPNLFFLTGPNTLPSGHSTLVGIECSVEYILRLIDPLVDKNTKIPRRASIQVKEVAQRAFNNTIQARMHGLVYTAEVGNWYFDKGSGRNTLIWPGTQLAFWWSRCLRKPHWGDFDIDDKGATARQ